MEKINGYDMSLWALMFHMKTQAKFVIDAEKKTGKPTFISPLAEEIERVMGMPIQTEFILTEANRIDIIGYMNNHIKPVIDTRKISPPLLLLVTINELYDVEFEPVYDILGTGIVKDFIDDFIGRAQSNPSLNEMYNEACSIVRTITSPFSIPFATKNKIKAIKEDFKTLLENAYGESKSHGWEHIDEVLLSAIYYLSKYNVEVDTEEVILAVLLHDIFSDTDRDNHHELAAKWVESSIHPLISKDKERQKRIANAIREHRASYVGGYYSTVSEVLATADREKPDLIKIITRMYLYRTEKGKNLNHKDILNDILVHLKEKYSRTGYIQYTKMYALEHEYDLAVMMDTIDKILAKKLVIKISNRGKKIHVEIKRK